MLNLHAVYQKLGVFTIFSTASHVPIPMTLAIDYIDFITKINHMHINLRVH